MSAPETHTLLVEQPAVAPSDALTAALPPGMSLQDVAVRLAAGICEAYAAYNNGSNLPPSLAGYNSFQIIKVFELDPNGNPFSTAEAKAQLASAARANHTVPLRAAAYASRNGAPTTPCTGPTPGGTPYPGFQDFGFTATANDGSHNILVFRGTVTLEEAGYDLLGWGNNTDCLFPSQSYPQTNFGPVNSYLYDFYMNADPTFKALSTSTIEAITATTGQNPGIPWIVGGHSLGGAIATLAALDGRASNVFGNTLPIVLTFGSLHVGDQTFADTYEAKVPFSLRIANLCDFVPSMVSLEPVIPSDPYVHVGEPGTFIWQTWDDWGNHSLANIYQPMVQSYWDIIHWGPRKYPQ